MARKDSVNSTMLIIMSYFSKELSLKIPFLKTQGKK